MTREAVFHMEFRNDLIHWKSTDRAVALRILDLVGAVLVDQREGIGNPTPLRGVLEGCWSRRIEQEHRLIYQVHGNRVHFLQARYYY